ncbi:RNA polymerase [Actinoplanes sp. TBRC 11911]|nr:RNA polymerase [Actinoplanes sp. TBRC 11911]
MVAFATRLTGDRGLAEDVVRETLVAAAHDPEALSGGRAHLFVLLRARVAGQVVGQPDPMAVLTALDSLPAEQRQVLDALYFQGRDVDETARSLGLEAGIVMSRSYQALLGLRGAVFEGAG